MESALAALSSTEAEIRSIALSGRPYRGKELPDVSVVEGIDYAESTSASKPDVLADRLEQSAAQALGGPPDVWHVHNHSLGKNPTLSMAIRTLAERGHGLLLHLHDFAEDGRPANYEALRNNLPDLSGIYPIGQRIRYAALNQRDASFLMEAGLPKEQLTLLPNPIRPPIQENDAPSPAKGLPSNMALCPVRAVRRKNLGELALLAAAHRDLTFANSLGPTNPAYGPGFQRWKDFAAHLELPVHYAFGEETEASFPQLVANARLLVTTSVAEGFGLAFLEPWGQGKSLGGRDLPEITADFRRAGLDLDHLYDRIELPVDCIDGKVLREKIQAALEKLFAAYGKAVPADGTKLAVEAMARNGRVDFGRLDEPLQEMLVESVHSSPELAREIASQANLVAQSPTLLAANAEVVGDRFGLPAYGQNLLAAYEEIAASDGGTLASLDANALLAAFLKPERLFLLRT